MAGERLLRKGCGEDNRFVEARVAALPQIFSSLAPIAIAKGELPQAKVHFPQPADVRRLVSVRNTPRQVILRGLLLTEETRKPGADDTGNPVHYEELAVGARLGLVQRRDGFVHVPHPMSQRNGRGVLRSQQTDGAQV